MNPMPPFTSHHSLFLQQKKGWLMLRVGSEEEKSNASTPPNTPKPLSLKDQAETTLLDNFILPTAKMSNELMHLDETLLGKKLHPKDAYSYEERVLLTYSDDTETGRFRHALRGALVGGIAGAITAVGFIPFNLLHTSMDKGINELKTAKDWGKAFLFGGLHQYNTDKYLRSVAVGVLQSVAAAAFTGMLVSENQTREQSTQADDLAQRMHTEVDKQKASPVKLKHHAEYHQIPQDYHEWQHGKTDWKNNLKSAAIFNYGFSSGMFLLQMGALGLILSTRIEKTSHNELLSFVGNAVSTNEKNSLLTTVVNWFDSKLIQDLNDIRTKYHEDPKKMKDELQKRIRTSMKTRLFERFSLVNLTRLGILSGLTAIVMAIRNARNLALIHKEVKHDMLEERKEELLTKGKYGHYPPIPGVANVTV
jgi:hypothetical protein